MDSTGGLPPGEGARHRDPASQEITPVTINPAVPLKPGRGYRRGHRAERDALADEREFLADDRDRVANEREAVADDREARADARERGADAREQSLDDLARRLGAGVASLEERALEQFDRARAVLDAQMQRLDRQEATLMRSRALRMRQDHATIRATAADYWDLCAAGSGDPLQEIAALTAQARGALDAFARTAEKIARHHDAAAVSNVRGDEHRRIAERAREAARRSIEIMGEFPADTASPSES